MISFFRKALSSWIVLALLGLVLVAFIITGIGDPFGGGPAATTVAEVAKDDISDAQLSSQFDRQLATVRQEQPGITAAQAVRGGMLEGVLERLIGSQALTAMGGKLGLGPSKRQVDAEIASIAAFRGPDGRFSEDVYRRTIGAQGLTEDMVRREIGGDVVRRQLLGLVDSIPMTPRKLAEPFTALQLEQRTIDIGAVPAQSFPAPTLSDADIEAFYKKNIANYTVPERRRLTYALIDSAEIAKTVQVTDAALADYYKRHADEFTASETRTLRQVVVQDKAQADTIAKRVNAGEDFAAVAQEVAGYSETDMELGTLSRGTLAGQTAEAVADAAFKAASGKVAGPVQSEFGWHVVHVDAVVAKPARTLAEVKDEIRPAVEAELAQNAVADVVEKADEALAEGASVAEVAKDLGLTLVRVPPVTSEGLTLGESGLQLDQRIRPLIERAFATEESDEPTVEDISDTLHALMDVEEVVPPTPVPLAEIKPQVTAALTFERRMEAAKAVADKVVAGLKAGKTLAALLAENKLPPAQSFTARRIEIAARREPVPPPISLGFALAKGDVRALAQPRNAAWFVVHVADVKPGNLAEAPAFLDQMRGQMQTAATNEYAQNFVAAIMADVGVRRNPKALERLKQRYLGTADQPQ
ncbi:peptidyl-prolyl cis-trans isomerase [Sphingosinicella microcystinivorans]|uniref:peptidyl-prolyl cis-trans isomerase n=1 Tax=Sphingosinicella microcystinivorans TaxID=335406 RepID=UPI0022F3B8D8|nr:peptidyl-prolyl cis-trans isomerase [Sphingosinicella microcystinivorans]WBX83377.1 SurA N-terminal domain-containing protein [Sphingosinicella microcystinivorans]